MAKTRDRRLVSNIRNHLRDLDAELLEVRLRTHPGSRTAAIEEARQQLRAAVINLNYVLTGPLAGDVVSANDVDALATAGMGLNPGRHLQAGDA